MEEEYIFGWFLGTPREILEMKGTAVIEEDVLSTFAGNAGSDKPLVAGVYQNANYDSLIGIRRNAALQLEALQHKKDSRVVQDALSKQDYANPHLISIVYDESNLSGETVSWIATNNTPTQRILCVTADKMPKYGDKSRHINAEFKTGLTGVFKEGLSEGNREAKLESLFNSIEVMERCRTSFGLTLNESVALLHLKKIAELNNEHPEGYFVGESELSRFFEYQRML